MLKVKDIMQRVPALSPEMGLQRAVDKIAESGLLGLPVTDQEQTLVGYLSEQDCLEKLLTESYHCDSHITVADIMNPSPLQVSEDLTVFALAQLMGSGKPKLYPVTRENRLQGLVSRGRW